MDSKNLKKLKKCLNCDNLITRYSTRCKSCASFERNLNISYRDKQSQANRGQKRSIEARLKMSESQKERFKNPQNHPRFGKGLIGNSNGMFKDGRTPLIVSLRHCKEYEDWRTLVFKRDSYTCQDCGQIGYDLEAHHIEAFSLIFDTFINQYNQFSIIEDKETLFRLAIYHKPMWDIDNGKTVCSKCHKCNYTTRPEVLKDK